MGRASRPRTLKDAIEYFSVPDRCLEFAAALRWPDGVTCPTCGGKDVTLLSTRRIWKCRIRHRHQQFSVKVGTIFEDSAVGFDKWFAAIWIAANSVDTVSSYQIARELRVTQKTAWHMMDRIRRVMRSQSFEKGILGDQLVVIKMPEFDEAESR
jgi:hypothetical protein